MSNKRSSGKHWKLTEERKKQIGDMNRGRKMTDEQKKRLSKSKTGVKRSLDVRKKLSESHKGSKSYLWKGGITNKNANIRNSFEFKLWRELVYERDDWTCCKCNNRGGNLNSHHILNFSSNIEQRFSTDNGITMCKKCHYNFHKKYGYTNNTKEQLEEFIIK